MVTARKISTQKNDITCTEVSDILSLNPHSKIADLVKFGVINSYNLPLTNRVRVRKTRVVSLYKKNTILVSPNDFEI